jgi:DNA-binding beta-propeller fold protein YncE
MYKKNTNFIYLILLLIFFSYCSDSTDPGNEIDYASIAEISYTEHVQPLIKEYLKILDDNALLPPGLMSDSWKNLIKGWDSGEVIIPFDSKNSLLIELNSLLDTSQKLADAKIEFLKRWIDEGARNDNGEVPYQNSEQLLYVCNQQDAIISVIDVNALLVTRNIKLTDFDIPVSAKPHHIAFSLDGSYFYVSCIDNQVNKILKFDRQNNQLLSEAVTDIPALMAHHPTENILYVSRFMLNNLTTSIFVLNTETMQPFDNGNNGEINLPPGLTIPHAIQVSKDGQYVYTCSFSEDQFVIINHENKTFEDAVLLGDDATPLQCAVSPDDKKVYISCIGMGEIAVINVSDPDNRFLETKISVGGQPWHCSFNSDGSFFYVGNLALNNVDIINTQDLSVSTVGSGDGTDGLSQPHGIAVSPDGKYVFISCRNTNGNYTPYYNFPDNDNVGTVVVINTENLSIEKVIEIEKFGSGMRLWSGQE